MDIRTEISPSEVMKNEASTNAEAAQSAGTSENARESACRELGSRILYTCRSEVCARFPFFSPGIAALSCEVISREKSRRTDLQEIHGIGTDGSRVYTVEGNSGDACKIRSYPLDYACIKGYGLMNWN